MSMSSSPILQEKRAIIFGAGGSIGAAVAKEFEVRRFFSRPHQIEGRRVTKQFTAFGGRAHAAVINTLVDGAVTNTSTAP
jgi:hypothetical protein